jgi:hypothetical protein
MPIGRLQRDQKLADARSNDNETIIFAFHEQPRLFTDSAFEKIDYFGFVLPKSRLIRSKVEIRCSCNQTECCRASSKARMANLRRDKARRSYRSMASNCLASCNRIVANLAGPSCAVVRNFSIKSGSGTSAGLDVRSCLMTSNFSRVSARDSKW